MDTHERDMHLETLDPQDWTELRALAHQMVDDAFDDLRSIRERPAWQPTPDEVAQRFMEPVPHEGIGAEAAYRAYRESVAPYPMGNTHPRFWAWYMGAGTMTGALGDFLAAAMNPNLGGANHAAGLVEEQVIRWCAEMTGLPEASSGLMTSGASMANLIGLAVARQVGAGFDVRAEGVAAAPKPLTYYASVEIHSCHQKAIELMGLGRGALRKLPVDSRYRLDIPALREAVARDRGDGFQPVCVVGTAGTINTGSMDDLDAIADVCAEEGLWFHVDGAIGALVTLSEELAPLAKGIERADSVALDLHKWMHVPFEAGVALVRDDAAHRGTFTLTPEYLEHAARGLASGARWFSDYGLQLSRGFKALKVWLSLYEHGVDVYGRLMEQNVAQAKYFARAVEEHDRLELMAPVGLDIVCFRFNPGGLTGPALNDLNRELLIRIHESGVAVPSYTTIHGTYCLRIAISNHRSTFEDFDLFAETVVDLGMALHAEAAV